MCLEKHNKKDSKNSKIELLMNMSNDTDHFVVLQALGWKPLKTGRKKSKVRIIK
jgi:hypothetical protein